MGNFRAGDFFIGLLGVIPLNYLLWVLLAGAYEAFSNQHHYVPAPLVWAWFTVANGAWVATALIKKRPFFVVGAFMWGAVVMISALVVGACMAIFGAPWM